MKHLTRLGLVAGCLAMAGGALAQSVDTSQPTGNVRFVSGPTGGTYYPLGEGIASILNRHSQGARASSSPTGGSTENARLISLNEADFGWAAADVVYYAFNGGREFDAPLANLRAVSAGHSSAGHFVVRADSAIQSVADLRGRSIGVGAAGSSNAQAAIEWLTTYGIDESEVSLQFISTSATVDALRDNTIDAGFQLAGVPSAGWQALAADHPIRFLSISDEMMAALNERLPFYAAEIIPAGTYEGQDEDVQTIGVKVILITRDDVPDIQAFEMARALTEHNDELTAAHPNGAEWDGTFAADAGFIPFHPGAVAFFEHAGIAYRAD